MFNRWRKKKPRPAEPTAKQSQPPALSAPFELIASMQSDVGCVREVNEDSGRYVKPEDPHVLASKGALFVVCDGMGGHSAGEIASRIAVETITRAYYEAKEAPAAALEKAVHQANREIYRTAQKDPSLQGMGTTLTALVLHDGSAFSAHVGDSRIYLVRDGQLYLLTEDHSAVMEMVKRGWISLEAARHHPDKNVILRALGSHPEVEVTTWEAPFPVRNGDTFMLCSDGLYDLVEDEEIRATLIDNDPHTACQALIAMARERGGHDNITVGIVRVQADADETNKAVRATREISMDDLAGATGTAAGKSASVPVTREVEAPK